MDEKTYSAAQIRIFGIGLAVILAALAGIQWWRQHPLGAAIAGALGLLALLLGLLAPGVMRPVHAAFLKVGAGLGWINTRILLAVIFYLVFTPAALVMKLLGRDALSRGFQDGAASYWIRKPLETRGVERYEKMY